jgi:threonine aldolase
MLGGGMRQAGVLAAAALYALDHHVDRLAEDHERARRLAEGLADAGVPVDVSKVETNFVPIPETDGVLERLRVEGVLLDGLRTGVLRAVTHLGVTDDDIDRAIDVIPAALRVEQRV